MQINKEELDESYLIKFEMRVKRFLESEINAKTKEEKDSPLEAELKAQKTFALNKRKDFQGQQLQIDCVKEYLLNDTQEPFIIFGASGMGKSSLIAKIIEEEENKNHRQIIYRFVKATPNSASTIEVLSSIFEEMGIQVISVSEKDNYDFKEFSKSVFAEIMNLKGDIAIFIDAVDQFHNQDKFKWLPDKLPKNVKIVISALDDRKYPDDSKYFQTLKTRISPKNLLEIGYFNKAETLMLLLLEKEHRTLQQSQKNYVLSKVSSAKSPLYIVVLIQLIKHWRSPENKEKKSLKVVQNLPSTQYELINQYINNLPRLHHHNIHFVHRVLVYIRASQNGLSEHELLRLISVDINFVNLVVSDEYHQNYDNGLPLIYWSRLYAELEPFISLRNIDGENAMYFFHREFEQCISELPSYKKEIESAIANLKELLITSQWQDFEDNRWGKLYLTFTLEYEDAFPDSQKHNEFESFIVGLSNMKWIESFIDYLNNEADAQKISSFDGSQPIRIQKKAVGILRNLYEISKFLHAKGDLTVNRSANQDIKLKYKNQNVENIPEYFFIEKYVGNLHDLARSYRKATPIQNNESDRCMKEASDVTRHLMNNFSEGWRGFHIGQLRKEYYEHRYRNHVSAIEVKHELVNLDYRRGGTNSELMQLVNITGETLKDSKKLFKSTTERLFFENMLRYRLRRTIEQCFLKCHKPKPSKKSEWQNYSECLTLLIENYEDPNNRQIVPNGEIIYLGKWLEGFWRVRCKRVRKISELLYNTEITLAEVTKRLGVGLTFDYLREVDDVSSICELITDNIIANLRAELKLII